MTNPQDVEAVIRRLAEARDEALWHMLYFKCEHCGKIKPISEAVGVEFPQEDGQPRPASGPGGWIVRNDPAIWCKSCFAEMPLG